MARDDDRPYEDGQGRSLDPEMTGDVLSPRWSTDDTDEQPAIQTSGNETYILPGQDTPAENGPVPPVELVQPVQPVPPAEPVQPAPPVPSAQPGYAEDARPEEADHTGDGPDDLHPGPGEAGYLPLDQGYGPEDGTEDEPRRGFLGSGWTGGPDDEEHGGEGRRRGRVLLVAAAAVVLVGLGAGWLLTGTNSDDPCAGGRCASVGDLSSPSPSADGEAGAPTGEATDPATPEPTLSESTPPASQPASGRVRPTRTAEPEPDTEPQRTRPRTAEPSSRPTGRATEAPVNEIGDADADSRPRPAETTREPAPERTAERAPAERTAESTQPPVTRQPEPTPSESRRGLFDVLFPWA